MKKNVLYFILGISIVSLFAFKMAYEPKKSTSEVNQYEGIYVYTDSKPVLEYDYLGTVKLSISLTGSGQYADIRDKLLKKAKKEYPNCEAIIFNFKDGGTDKADVVKFK